MSENQLKLLVALKENNVEEFMRLLENDDVDPSYSYGKPDWGTCLELACKIGDRGRFVEVLLKKVKPNRNVLQPEAIHVAAKYGNFGALQVLLRDKRTRINAEDKKGRTALHLLASNFRNDPLLYKRCLELLLARSDVDVNKPNFQGCTAIYEAAVYGGKEAVIAMLNFCPAGMDVDTQRGDGRNAREEILKVFPELGPLLPPLKVAAPSTSEPQTVLLAALQNKYLDVFKGLLQQVDSDGARVMNPDHFYSKPFNCTCLEAASREPRLYKFVDVLLQAGADPNYVNPITDTAPIHVAVRCVNTRALNLLIDDKRTNVNIADRNSNTALHFAAAFVGSEDDAVERNKSCVKLLLSHETIDLNIRNVKNFTPIMEAAQNGNRYVVEIIVEMSDKLLLDLDGTDTGGLTAREHVKKIFPDIELPTLHIVTSEDPFKIHKVALFNELYKHQTEKFERTVQLISDNKMHQLIDSDDGTNTLLQYACTYGFTEEAKILLLHGANPNLKFNINPKPPIVIACLHKHFDVLNILLNNPKIKINETDQKGNTALHIAGKQKNLEAVVRLINCGADLKAKNVFGFYPLTPHAMKSLFDQCLKPDETLFPEDDNYKFTFQYDLLIAHRPKFCKRRPKDVLLRSQTLGDYISVEFEPHEQQQDPLHEMEFLRFVAESGLYNELLKHPIVTSFLCVKWPKLKKFYIIDIIWCISFVVVFNFFVALNCNSKNAAICPTYSWLILVSLIGILLLMMAIRKVTRACVEFAGYFRDYENWFDIILFILSIASCIFTSSVTAVLCVIMSWSKLIFLTGQLTTFSGNIHMLKTVTMNFARVFALYSSLLMMFVVCFYVLFRNDVPQKDVSQSSNSNFTFGYSVFRVIVMMTGEYDTSSLPLNNVPYASYFVFCLFIFLVSIVLINLLTGLAVSDIHAVKQEAEILGIHSRILLMSDIEKHWLPILRKFVNISDTKVFHTSETVIDVFPNKQKLLSENAWNIFCDDKLHVEDHIDIESLQGALKIIAEKSMTDNSRVTKKDMDDMKTELFQLIHELLRKIDNRTESVPMLK